MIKHKVPFFSSSAKKVTLSGRHMGQKSDSKVCNVWNLKKVMGNLAKCIVQEAEETLYFIAIVIWLNAFFHHFSGSKKCSAADICHSHLWTRFFPSSLQVKTSWCHRSIPSFWSFCSFWLQVKKAFLKVSKIQAYSLLAVYVSTSSILVHFCTLWRHSCVPKKERGRWWRFLLSTGFPTF